MNAKLNRERLTTFLHPDAKKKLFAASGRLNKSAGHVLDDLILLHLDGYLQKYDINGEGK